MSTTLDSSHLADRAGIGAAAPARPLPPFTEEYEALRRRCGAFVESELAPHAAEWEEARWFPDSVFPRVAEQGYSG